MSVVKLLASTEERIDLLRGCPSPKLLPAELLSAGCQRVLANPNNHEALLNYGQPLGYQPLREALASWLGEHYDVHPDPNRICVTGGASQSLACILQSFTDPAYTRAIWMVAPCYFLAASIFEDSGFENRLKAVSEDDEGFNIEELEQKLIAYDQAWAESQSETKPFKSVEPNRKLYRHIIYCVPTCANPSGKTMPVHRREALVRLARKYDALIICDDVYDLLQWPQDEPIPANKSKEMRLPRLCDIDRVLDVAEDTPSGFGNAVSNGSFSKLAGPGIRTGWVEATPAFAMGLAMTGSSMSGGPPSQLCAGIMADLLSTNELQRHLEQHMKPALQRRERMMREAVEKYLVPKGVQILPRTGAGIGGGYFIWLKLGPGQSANALVQKVMQEENVLVGNGGLFSVRGDSALLNFDENIRLCFSWESEDRIAKGVKKVGEVLSRSQPESERAQLQT